MIEPAIFGRAFANLADVAARRGKAEARQVVRQAEDRLVMSTSAREAARRTVAAARSAVKEVAFGDWLIANPQGERAAFEAWLRSPAGSKTRTWMVQDVRRVTHGQALAFYGITTPKELAPEQAVKLRTYMFGVKNNADLATVSQQVGAALQAGGRDAAELARGAELKLMAQRGVAPEALKGLARLDAGQLAELRHFADGFAPSQSGKYLALAATGPADLNGLKRTMARQLARDNGLFVPASGLDEKVLLSLLADMGNADPRDARVLAHVASSLIKGGERDYTRIHTRATRTLLANLGLPGARQKALDVPAEALKAAFPALDPALARAEQLRLLRDRLRVLPEAQRQGALKALGSATLLDFDQHLQPLFRQQTAGLVGSADLAARLLRDMPAQQQANLVAELANLPAEVRQGVFAGLAGTPDQRAGAALDRLVERTQQRFGVTIHRTPGAAPIPGEANRAVDWTVQGVSALYNGLDKVTAGKDFLVLRQTTYVHLASPEGKLAADAPALTAAQDGAWTLYRPGADRYRPVQDGRLGNAFSTMGYRQPDGDRELVALFEGALQLDNGNRAAGRTLGEGTVVHETSHVLQLHGPQQRENIGAWSKLGGWTEPDGSVSDGFLGQGYSYKNPQIKVADRGAVVSDYGASDPVEDWAEYARTFALDPKLAWKVSRAKFAYMNTFLKEHFSPEQVRAIAGAFKQA